MVASSCKLPNSSFWLILFLPGILSCVWYEYSLNDTMENKELTGQTYQNVSSTDPFTCFISCADDCRCLSFQITDTRCELLVENHLTSPGSLITTSGYSYYYMKRGINTNITTCHYPSCCDQSVVCQNGGTCQSLCTTTGRRFNCTCSPGYIGNYCQIAPKSCTDILKHSETKPLTGTHLIFDQTNNSYPVFCDFDTEPGSSWTMILSFSLANKTLFNTIPLFDDKTVSENVVNWEGYRLSKDRMSSLRGVTSFFRATCNYPTAGIDYTDYLRGRFSDLDLMQATDCIAACKMFDFVNCHGFQCTNCTCSFWQIRNSMFPHIDWTIGTQCTSGDLPITNRVQSEDTFGYLLTLNPLHRCASHSSSTTQWWFGNWY